MSKATWETRSERVTDLFLDEANVRLDLRTDSVSQDALIEDLFVNQRAFEVAQSIVRYGWFQHELPIVLRESGRLVVVEGNRRVAALKALIEPNLMPAFASRLKQLKTPYPTPAITSIEVKIAPSRDAVSKILATIHTTKGRESWPRLRQAYFYCAQVEGKTRTVEQLIVDYPGVNVARFIRMWEMHRIARSLDYGSEEQNSEVSNQQSFPISTLERLYNNPTFQSAFGLSFDPSGQVKIKADRDSFNRCFRRVVSDIVGGIEDTRTINKAEQIEVYVARIERPTMRGRGRPLTANAFKPSSQGPRTRKPRALVPKNVQCTINAPAVKRMLVELQGLNYSRFPNAAHDLLRSFLECSLKAYFDHRKITVTPRRGGFVQLADLLELGITHFDTEKKSLVQPIHVLKAKAGSSMQNYLYSVDFLNAINHNHNVFSTGDDVEKAWDQMAGILIYCLDPK